MNAVEFGKWRRHYAARFTGFGEWLMKFPDISEGEQPTRREVLAAWFQALAACDVHDAITATEQLFSDPDRPRGYSDHPAEIARRARVAHEHSALALSPMRVVDGEITYRCPRCLDQGRVIIFSPEAIRFVEKNGAYVERSVRYPSTSVRCDCEAGSRKCHAWPVCFDPKRDFIWSVVPDQFVEWVNKRKNTKIERHPNYNEEFSAFV